MRKDLIEFKKKGNYWNPWERTLLNLNRKDLTVFKKKELYIFLWESAFLILGKMSILNLIRSMDSAQNNIIYIYNS